jgi:hypothetical protein
MADAKISIADSGGTLITNTFQIFDETVDAGGGVYTGTVRVYNNKDQDSGVAHARDVVLYASPVSGSIGYNTTLGEYNENISTIPFVFNTLSGSCVYSSKTDSAIDGTVQSLSVGIRGTMLELGVQAMMKLLHPALTIIMNTILLFLFLLMSIYKHYLAHFI